ncbi:hypothetical protein [Streptomyces antibioticus]|uniref:hypothetical protein n=1 Tax=Streptomyces antibioticus TaxID=1890 RepID=UPI0033DE3529
MGTHLAAETVVLFLGYGKLPFQSGYLCAEEDVLIGDLTVPLPERVQGVLNADLLAHQAVTFSAMSR